MIDVSPAVARIGFCADIHGAYNRVLTLRDEHPDVGRWFCAGDVVDFRKALHYNQPTLRVMHRLGIPSVMGNHGYRFKEKHLHRLDEEARAYLAQLPFRLDVRFAGLRVRIYHATRESRESFALEWASAETLRTLFSEEDADIIVLGHTHKPYMKRIDGTQFINPGALGVPEENPPSFCILDKDGSVEIQLLEREA